MKEKIVQLENLLVDIYEHIEQHLEISQIDLEEFDSIQNSPYIEREKGEEIHAKAFREKIVEYKTDSSFWDKEAEKLIEVLTAYKNKIQSIKISKTEISNLTTKDLQIGGKDQSNEDIIKLLRQGIITTQTPITKVHKGQQAKGYLTEDGYLEIEINNLKKKFSLRRAAIYVFGTDPQNQWKFWEAVNNKGQKQSLEEFRDQIN